MTNWRVNIQLNGKVYFTGNVCCIGNCCDDEMLALAYLSLHSPPLSVLWRVQWDINKIQVQPREQMDTAVCRIKLTEAFMSCNCPSLYNSKFRQNQFSKNGPDTRLQTDGNDINNRQCFRILRGESRKRPVHVLSKMIQNVVVIMFAV
jgi:hypothetical protein